MLPFQLISGGNFTLTTALIAQGIDLDCPGASPPNLIQLQSLNWGKANTAQSIYWFWEQTMAQDTAKGTLQSSAATGSCALTSIALSSSAINTYSTLNPPSFAGLATTNIAGNTGTFVVTMANTGTIQVGDWVRIINPTGELQIGGYTFQVTAVTANVSITLGYMATGGITFAAAATAGTVIKYIPSRFYPRFSLIANITQAAQPKIFFTGTNYFTVGEIVSFRVGSLFGMSQINNLTGQVVTVTNTATESSIVVNLLSSAGNVIVGGSSGFTAFTFPTSAQALTTSNTQTAVCLASSSGVVPNQSPPGINLLDTFDNRNKFLIHLNPGLFNVSSFTSANGDVWTWRAYVYDKYVSGNLTYP